MTAQRAYLLAATSLTPVHPGAGRTVGVVDLPIIRDSRGYPYVPGSEVKGALKSLIARKLAARELARIDDKGAVDCTAKEGINICCLMGREREGEAGEGSSALSFINMQLVALPAPSPTRGLVYITTQSLLANLADYLEVFGDTKAAEGLRKAAEEPKSSGGPVASFKPEKGNEVWVGFTRLKVASTEIAGKAASTLSGYFTFGGLPSTIGLTDSLLIVPESMGASLLNKFLLVHTRVRLDRTTKTVSRGALWTEEYIPYGAILAGLVIDTEFRNAFCGSGTANALEDLAELLKKAELLNEDDTFYLVVGGKETVGGGLLKLKLWRSPQGAAGREAARSEGA